MTRATTLNRRLTPKQRVLKRYKGAWLCCAYSCAKMGYVVHPAPKFFSSKKLGKRGRTPAEAWANAAAHL